MGFHDESLQELIENNFNFANTNLVLYNMVDEIAEYKLDAMRRWGNQEPYSWWINNVSDASYFMNYKYMNYLKDLEKSL